MGILYNVRLPTGKMIEYFLDANGDLKNETTKRLVRRGVAFEKCDSVVEMVSGGEIVERVEG